MRLISTTINTPIIKCLTVSINTLFIATLSLHAVNDLKDVDRNNCCNYFQNESTSLAPPNNYQAHFPTVFMISC